MAICLSLGDSRCKVTKVSNALVDGGLLLVWSDRLQHILYNPVDLVALSNATLNILSLHLVVQTTLNLIEYIGQSLAVSGLQLKGNVLFLSLNKQFLALGLPLCLLLIFNGLSKSLDFLITTFIVFGFDFLITIIKVYLVSAGT